MGGELRAESAPGEGSRFIVEIPVEMADSAEETLAPVLTGVGIGVVDPNAMVRASVKETLDALGARTVVAPSMEAFGALLGSDPDVSMVLVDFAHEPQHLREVAGRIRELCGSAHLVLLSTMSDRADALAHVGTGFDDVLLKPIRYRRLMDAVAPVALGVTEAEPPTDIFAQSSVGDGVPEGSGSVRGGRVLLVEDEPVNRLVAGQMIQKLGHDVTIVGNGQEAVELLERVGSDGFDIVFMDCQTPVLDGFQATAQIRARESNGGPRAKIVALTASALQGDREKCIAAGMDDYLSKPVRIGDVEEMLVRWLPKDDEQSTLGGAQAPSQETGSDHADLPSASDPPGVSHAPVARPPSIEQAPSPPSAPLRVRAGVAASGAPTTPGYAMPPGTGGTATRVRVRAGTAAQVSQGPTTHSVRERSAGVGATAPGARPRMESRTAPAQSHPPTSDLPVFDEAAALDILGGDWDLFWTISRLFIDGWADAEARLEIAVSTGDLDALERTAHFLKGGSGNVGAARIRYLSAALEKRASEGGVSDARARVEELRQAMADYRGEIERARQHKERDESAAGA